MEKVTKFECLDSYESEKLGSMLLVDKDNMNFVIEVIKVVDNEIILMLKDKSCHSILMQDNINAVRLKEFLRELIFGALVISKITNKENILNIIYKIS